MLDFFLGTSTRPNYRYDPLASEKVGPIMCNQRRREFVPIEVFFERNAGGDAYTRKTLRKITIGTLVSRSRIYAAHPVHPHRAPAFA